MRRYVICGEIVFMPELKPEIIGLLIGLSFSIAVFAFKTAVGEFYFLTGNFRRKEKFLFLSVSTLIYGILFAAAFAVNSLLREKSLFLIQNHNFFQAGIVLHLIVAAGFFLWGVLLLTAEREHHRSRGWWFLVIPCPVCASAIFLASAFAELLLPESGWLVRLFVPGVFFLVNFSVLGILSAAVRKGGLEARGLTGRLMLFVGLYFAGLLLLVPNFDRVEQMYRVVAGNESRGDVNYWLVVFLGILLLAGWLFQVYRNSKQQRCGSVRRGVE